MVNIGYSLTVTSTGSGNWNDVGTWDIRIPLAGDDVVIANGHTVDLDVNTPDLATLDIQTGGTLQPLATGGANTITLSGNLTVEGTFTGVIGGDIARMTFDGSSGINVTGTFAPELVTVNVGSEILLNTNVNISSGNPNFQINGTFVVGPTGILNSSVGSFNLNSGATYETTTIGVSAGVTGAITKNFNALANYYLRIVADTDFGTITDVHDIVFENCTVNTTSDLTISGRISEFGNSTIDVLGDGDTWTLTGNETGDTGLPVDIDNLVVNGNYNGFGRLRIGNQLTIGAGAVFTTNTNLDLIFSDGASIVSSGTLNAGTFRPLGNLTSNGDINFYDVGVVGASAWTHSAGTVTLLNTVEDNDDFDFGSFDFANLTVSGTGWTSSTNITVQNNLTVTGSLNCTAADFTINGGNISGGGTVTFNNFIIGGNVTQVATDVTVNGDINLVSHTLDVGTNSLELQRDIVSTTGNIDLTENASTLILSGATPLIIDSGELVSNQIGNLTVTKSSSVDFNDNTAIYGTLTLNNASAYLDFNGNALDFFGTFNYIDGEIGTNCSFNKFSTNSFTMPDLFENRTVNNFILRSAGTVTFANDLTTDLVEMSNVGAILDIQTNTLTVNGDINIAANNGQIDLTEDSSTLILTAGTDISNVAFINGEIGNLTLQRATTTTLEDDLTIDGTLTLDNTSCVLDIATFNLEIGGNLVHNSGEIDATDDASTLTFSGTGAISLDANIFQNNEVGNLINDQADDVTLNNDLTVDGTMTLNNGGSRFEINGNQLTLNGNLVRVAGVVDANPGTVEISGNGALIIPNFFFAGNQLINGIFTRIGVVTISSELSIEDSFIMNQANLDINLETNGATLNIRCPLTHTNGIISAESAGTINFSDNSADDIDAGLIDGQTVFNLEIGGARTLSLKEDLTIDNNLEITSAVTIFDIEGNQLTIDGSFPDQSGEIDATDDASTVEIGGTGAINLNDVFVNDEVGNLTVTRTGGTTTQTGNLTVDGTLTVNSGQTFDMASSTLTLNDDFSLVFGIFDLDDVGDALVISNSANIATIDITDFTNNTVYEAYFLKALSIGNDPTFVNRLEVENGLADFGNNTVDIQGNVTLDNGGSIFSGGTGTFEFTNTSTLVNNSNGTISLNDVNVTGTLNTSPNITIGGDLTNSGVFNQTAGITTFTNIAQRTITNTGTMDFNDVVIDNGSNVTTDDDFDINGDLTLNNATSVFNATTPSNITFTKTNAVITTAANANAAGTSGLSFYDFTLSQNANLNGAFGTYFNGGFFTSNRRLTAADGSTLYFTSNTRPTNFGYLTCDNLVFTGTADFDTFNLVTDISGDLTLEAGANIIMYITTFDDTDNDIINTAPNDYTNLTFQNVDITGTTNTSTDLEIIGVFNIAASGDFTQSAGTINFGNTASIVNDATQSDLVLFNVRVDGNPTSTADFIVDDDFTVVAGPDSFIASDGEVLFNKANLAISNNGTLTFYDVEFAGTVTNGSTGDDFTVANDLTMNTNAYFTAADPAGVTFSGNPGVITTTDNADRASVGLNLHDIDIQGTVSTSGANIVDVDGDFSVTSGAFTGDNSSTIYLSGTSGVISNNATLDFETLVIGSNATGTYTTADNFDINEDFEVEAGAFFEATDGEIAFDGTANVISSSNSSKNNLTFYDLRINSENATTSSSFSIGSDYSITSDAVMQHTGGELHFIGGLTHTLNNIGSLEIWDFIIEDSNGNLVQTDSDFEVDGTEFIISGNSSSFNANDGEIDFSNSSGTIFNNGTSSNLIFNDLNFVDASLITLDENDDFELIGDFTYQSNGNFKSTGTSEITFNGSSEQNITGNGGSATFQNFTLNNSSGLELNGDIELNHLKVEKDLRLNNGNIDLNGDNILTMIQPDAYLYETGGHFVNDVDRSDTEGHIYYEYDFNSRVNDLNLFGLGLGIRQSTPFNLLGNTILKRYHTNLEPTGGDAIKRYYSIEASNDAVNAIVSLAYFDSELGSITEDNLILLSNRTPTDNWAARETELFTAINRVTHTDSVYAFDDFETIWTASEPLLLDLIENQSEEADTSLIPNGRLIAGEEYMILGFALSADGSTNVEEVKIYLNGNSRGQLENFKLYLSEDDVFNTIDDNILVADSVETALDSIQFIENLPISSSENLYFFLTAFVNDTSSIYSPSAQAYVNQAGIRSTDGIVNIYEIFGPDYRFQQRLDISFNPVGLDQPSLYPNMKDLAIYGFQINPLGNEASFGGFDLDLGIADEDAFSGEFHLFRSVDDNYLSQDDNVELELVTDVLANGSRNYSFDINPEQVMELAGRYYFIVIDSVANNANEGIDLITPRVPSQSLRASEAAPVALDSAYGITYDFKDLEVVLTNHNIVSSKTLSIGVSDQTIYGFSLEPEDNAVFSSLLVNLSLTDASLDDFFNFKLFHDINKNGVAEKNEQISLGEASSSEVEFNNFTETQNLAAVENYLITCKPRNTIDPAATLQIVIPDDSYVFFESPAYLVAGGPFSGARHSFAVPGVPSAIEIINLSPSSIINGDEFEIALKMIDANGNLAINIINENLEFSFSGDADITGTTNRLFQSGNSIETYSSFFATTSDDYSEFSFEIDTDNFGTINSGIYSVFSNEPSSSAGDIVLSAGSPSSSAIRVENWSSGSGDGRIIVARVGNTPNNPKDGVNYEPITNLRNVGNVDINQTDAGSIVIYDGNSTSPFEITGLMSGETYYFRIYEYNISNGRYNYFIPTDIDTYYYTTEDVGEQFSDNIDTNSAPSVPEDFVIEGSLKVENEADWYKHYVSSENSMIQLCGDNRLFELYYQENDGSLSLYRVNENVGESCGVIILNNAPIGNYFMRVSGTDLGGPPLDYSFKIIPLRGEIFSREDCNCP